MATEYHRFGTPSLEEGHGLWKAQPLADVLYHYNATNQASASGTNGRIAYQTPIAAFGSRMGGTPLYVGTQCRFGTAPGVNLGGTKSPMFYMLVYESGVTIGGSAVAGTSGYFLGREIENRWIEPWIYE